MTAAGCPGLHEATVAEILDRAAVLAARRESEGKTPADLIDQAAAEFGSVTVAMAGNRSRASDGRPVKRYAARAMAEAAAATADGGPAGAREMLAEWSASRPPRTRSQTAGLLNRAARRLRADAPAAAAATR